MGFFFGGISTTVTISGGATITGEEISTAGVDDATNGNVTIGTVGVGKVWKVYGWMLSCGSTKVSLLLNGVTVDVLKPGTNEAPNHTISLFPNYVELAAGETAVKNGAGAGNTIAYIYYVEEDA